MAKEYKQYQDGWNAAKRNDNRIPPNCPNPERWIEGYNAYRSHQSQNMMTRWRLDQMLPETA